MLGMSPPSTASIASSSVQGSSPKKRQLPQIPMKVVPDSEFKDYGKHQAF